jgi:hypothetical protein
MHILLFICNEWIVTTGIPDNVLALPFAGCNSVDTEKIDDIGREDFTLFLGIDSGKGIKVIKVTGIDKGCPLVLQLK